LPVRGEPRHVVVAELDLAVARRRERLEHVEPLVVPAAPPNPSKVLPEHRLPPPLVTGRSSSTEDESFFSNCGMPSHSPICDIAFGKEPINAGGAADKLPSFPTASEY
jgi:hypothetical protein